MNLLKKIIVCCELVTLVILPFSYSVKLHGAERCSWSAASARQGKKGIVGDREFMQDRYKISESEGLSFFGLYDGHGGTKAADYVEEHLHENFSKAQGETISERLKLAFLKTDKDFLDKSKFSDDFSGTTAVVAVSSGDKLWIANAGDSRAILVRGGKKFFTTKDHKPDVLEERKRIERKGSFVYTCSSCEPPASCKHSARVDGCLAVSRAIGDAPFKINGSVIADPDVEEIKLEDDDFVVLGCDGLFDAVTNQEVALFVYERLNGSTVVYDSDKNTGKEIVQEGGDKQVKLVAQALRDKAYKEGSEDNITVLVASLAKNAPNIKVTEKRTVDGFYLTKLFKSVNIRKWVSFLGLGMVSVLLYKLYCLSKVR